MINVLITGHRGFVGSHFWTRFNNERFRILGVDITDPWNPQDARDFFRKESRANYDLVIHCAAVVGGRATIESEPLKVATDFSIDAEAFQWAARTKPACFVYFSSSAAYPVEYQNLASTYDIGRSLWEGMIREYEPQLPDQSYGWVKLMGEMQCHLLRLRGVRTMIVRPFSGYGADQDRTYPVPSIVKRAIEHDDPIQIWSDTTRDLVHIDDIVECVVTAWLTDHDGPFNICTGVPTSFSELARIAMEAVGYEAPIEIIGGPRGVTYRVGDPSSMEMFYKPKISVRDGIERMVEEMS